jgi:hypothetical protein
VLEAMESKSAKLIAEALSTHSPAVPLRAEPESPAVKAWLRDATSLSAAEAAGSGSFAAALAADGGSLSAAKAADSGLFSGAATVDGGSLPTRMVTLMGACTDAVRSEQTLVWLLWGLIGSRTALLQPPMLRALASPGARAPEQEPGMGPCAATVGGDTSIRPAVAESEGAEAVADAARLLWMPPSVLTRCLVSVCLQRNTSLSTHSADRMAPVLAMALTEACGGAAGAIDELMAAIQAAHDTETATAAASSAEDGVCTGFWVPKSGVAGMAQVSRSEASMHLLCGIVQHLVSAELGAESISAAATRTLARLLRQAQRSLAVPPTMERRLSLQCLEFAEMTEPGLAGTRAVGEGLAVLDMRAVCVSTLRPTLTEAVARMQTAIGRVSVPGGEAH